MKAFSVEHFRDKGFTGPVKAFTDQEALEYLSLFQAEVFQNDVQVTQSKYFFSAWHHRLPWTYELVTDNRILDYVEAILGSNVFLWAVHFWYKPPGHAKRIPWHQDGAYWPMRPKKNVTVWITLGQSTVDNGCLRFIPGTHKQLCEAAHQEVDDQSSEIEKGLLAGHMDESKAIDMEMQPGEIILFNESLIHGSNPNLSDIPRVALSARFTTPDVKFLTEQWDDASRIKTFLVRGQDNCHLNDAIRREPPVR